MNALDQAVKHANGVSKLATALGVRQSTISNWRARGSVPVDNCPAIERVTERAVTCEQLRPDITWNRDEDGNVTGYTVPLAAPLEPQGEQAEATADAA